MSTVQIRPLREEDVNAFAHQMARGFGYAMREDREAPRAPTMEVDRAIAGWDGEELVATAGAYTQRMTVPGWGTAGLDAGCAGVTEVTVRSTHRRRGVLTAMMRQQLEDVRARGEPIAALWASESSIYGRFGYGCAITHELVSIDRQHAVLRQPVSLAAGSVRLLARDEARKVIRTVWEAERAERPGLVSRGDDWLEHRVLDEPRWMSAGFPEQEFVAYEEDGALLGYARYRVKGDLTGRLPSGKLRVGELVARTPAAHGALWAHIFGVDLVAEIDAGQRPVDEPLNWLLADPRRLRRVAQDAIWLRIVDVPAALSARRYAADARLVLEVEDAFLPGAGGRFALEGGPAGAICKPTTESADLTLSAGTLGAIYLGGASPTVLAEAGLIVAPPQAIRTATRLFASDRVPWCPEHF